MHHWKPTDYFDMTPGQRRVVRAFLQKECEDIEEELGNIGK